MNLGIENIHLNQKDWPEVLTPDLRQQLLLGKMARAQQAIEQRRKCTNRQLLVEPEGRLVHDQYQR